MHHTLFLNEESLSLTGTGQDHFKFILTIIFKGHRAAFAAFHSWVQRYINGKEDLYVGNEILLNHV